MTSLTPVLELEPAAFAMRSHQTPSGSATEDPEGWFRYWSESLADAGIRGLIPWKRGSWFVTLDQLSDPALLRLLVNRLRPDIATSDLDEIGPLSGGYILSHEETTIQPGCCCDLGDLESWRLAASDPTEAWSMVWIGHPWTFIRSSGDLLHLVEPSEQDSADGLTEIIHLSRAELREAVARARAERSRFAERLLPVVEEMAPKVAPNLIVDVLVGGHGD
jgi:hypothetical protein